MKLPVLREPNADYLAFEGGFDQVTPAWSASPGTLRLAQNYEIDINGGYVDVTGYERYSGKPKPSDAQYAILNVTITGSFAVGDQIVGVTSSATATVAAVITQSPAYLVITKITSTFQAETINVSSSPQGTSSGAQAVGGALTQDLNAQYLNLAADIYRSDIAAVTGSGNILGGFNFNDVQYVFRNSATPTTAAMFKSSSSGWTEVALGRELSFTSGGVTEIVAGNTITGETSGAYAVVTRVVLEIGSWASGNAEGRFIFASQTGTFQAETVKVGAALNLATIAANSSAITLLPGGRYEFEKHNFGGAAGAERIYGCDGVNRGFEFDGTVFVPINTGMTVDTPTHVTAHKNHLFFSFSGSAQHSATGFPYIWDAIFGAAEMATGDTITGFKKEPGAEGGATLVIYCRNRISVLYGSDSSTWEMVSYREELGAAAYTVQQIGMTLFLDDRGITNFQTTQRYGNFVHSTLSTLAQPFLNERRSLATASCVSRNKNQYRLFFSDGYALYITMSGNKIMGIMPILFPDAVTCAWSDELANGTEVMYFGSDNGMVYQMESGTSFDGEAIDAYLFFHYHYAKMLRRNKRWKDAALDASGTGYAKYNFSYELDYNSVDKAQISAETTILSFAASYWDTGNWDVGTWDGQTLKPGFHKLTGSSENIALVIIKTSDYYKPIRFSGSYFRFIPGRQLR